MTTLSDFQFEIEKVVIPALLPDSDGKAMLLLNRYCPYQEEIRCGTHCVHFHLMDDFNWEKEETIDIELSCTSIRINAVVKTNEP